MDKSAKSGGKVKKLDSGDGFAAYEISFKKKKVPTKKLSKPSSGQT